MHLRPARGTRLALALATAVLLGGCSVTPGVSPSATTGSAGPPSPSTGDPGTAGTPTPTPTPTTEATPPIPRFRGRITVLGLGDSVTSGFNCDCTDFITQLAARLPPALGAPGTGVNLGRPGLTTIGLQHQLASDAATRRSLSHAGVVVVTIGANDLGGLVPTWLGGACPSSCFGPVVGATGGRLAALLSTVRRLSPQGARILVTTYWAVFQDGDVARTLRGAAFLPWADTLTRAANRAICAAAAGVAATCVDLYAPFKGSSGEVDDTDLLAQDGDHPNAAGEAVITRALRRALS